MFIICVGMSFDLNLVSFLGGLVVRVWKQVIVDGYEVLGCLVCFYEQRNMQVYILIFLSSYIDLFLCQGGMYVNDEDFFFNIRVCEYIWEFNIIKQFRCIGRQFNDKGVIDSFLM